MLVAMNKQGLILKHLLDNKASTERKKPVSVFQWRLSKENWKQHSLSSRRVIAGLI